MTSPRRPAPPRPPRAPRSRAGRRLPKEVYIRRRVAAVVILLLVVALLWWAIASLFGGDDARDTQNTAATQSTTAASQESSASASPVEPPKQDAASSPAPTPPRESPQAAPAPVADGRSCDPAELEVVAVPGAPAFAADQPPNFFAKVTNKSGSDCTLDLDANRLSFEVFALQNYQRIWGDTDCNASGQGGKVVIPAGQTNSYELKPWSRTTSAPGQCDKREPVQPGAYLLYTHVGGKVSPPVTFNLV